jgi:hypothetical protein
MLSWDIRQHMVRACPFVGRVVASNSPVICIGHGVDVRVKAVAVVLSEGNPGLRRATNLRPANTVPGHMGGVVCRVAIGLAVGVALGQAWGIGAGVGWSLVGRRILVEVIPVAGASRDLRLRVVALGRQARVSLLQLLLLKVEVGVRVASPQGKVLLVLDQLPGPVILGPGLSAAWVLTSLGIWVLVRLGALPVDVR